MANAPRIKLRGSRTPIPQGYVIGRISPKSGDAELINLRSLGIYGGGASANYAIATAITQLAGDVTAVGPGAVTATIPNDTVTYAKMQNVSATQRVLGRNTAGAGDVEEVSASGVLDWIGATQGQILYRGAAGWSVLNPGTSGYFLKTLGAGADPVWAVGGGGGGSGTFIGLTDVPAAFTGAALYYVRVNAGETALEFQAFPTLVTAFTGLSDAPASYAGSGGYLVRVNAGATALEFFANPAITSLTGDVTASGPGAVAATIANDAVTYAKMQNISATQRVLGRNSALAGDTEEVTATQLLDWIGGTQGQVLYRGAAGWSALNPGTSGQFLKTQGAAADPIWAAAASAFTSLSDAPASYTGHALKYVRVNAGETALEFQTFPTLVTAFTQLSDVPANYTSAGGKSVRVNSGATALEFVTIARSVAFSVAGLPRASAIVAYWMADADLILPASLTDSQAYCLDKPSASVTFDIEESTTKIGEVTFTNASNVGSFTFTTQTTINKGNSINIRAPADVKGIMWMAITLRGIL